MSLGADHHDCRNLQECRCCRSLVAINAEEGGGSGSGAMGVADTAGEEPAFLVRPAATSVSPWTIKLCISSAIPPHVIAPQLALFPH